jgi:hypothetical protein
MTTDQQCPHADVSRVGTTTFELGRPAGVCTACERVVVQVDAGWVLEEDAPVLERCGETHVLWPDDEHVDTECTLPAGHVPAGRHTDGDFVWEG